MADFTRVIRQTRHIPTLRAIMMRNLGRIATSKALKHLFGNADGRRGAILAKKRYGACRYRLKFLRSHGAVL